MTTPNDTGVETTQGQDATGTGSEAPWASYLNDLPDSVRPLVEPKFREWDSQVTQRFQKVHSDYEPLKAYQPLVENGYDFNDVQQAIQLAQLINEDPQRVYTALAENFGFGSEQGQVGEQPVDTGETDENGVPYSDPRYDELAPMVQTMAEIMNAQHQQQVQAQEDAELDQTLTALKDKHGEFDADYVMTKVYAGATWDQAIQQYQQITSGRANANAPVVMGAGGGMPSQTVNPATMSDRDRKALVAQMLQQANQQT